MTKFIENRQNTREPQKDILVFYHADCTDGFTAAWVAWKKFGTDAEYIARFHYDEAPNFKGKTIYTLDITFSREDTERLMKDNRVTSIDHHISTKDIVLMTNDPLYSTDHSGSTLAWQYFYSDEPVPRFLLNVEDVDLWRQKIPEGPVLYAYLDLFDFSFENWSKLIKNFEDPVESEKIIEQGNLLLRYEEKNMDRTISKNAKLVEFEGYKVYALNTTESSSMAGAKLANLMPPLGIVWKENKDGHVLVSLRGDGNIDLSVIAIKYGGGGHRNSAAFRLESLADITWKENKK